MIGEIARLGAEAADLADLATSFPGPDVVVGLRRAGLKLVGL